ncbi:OB-fold-containig protein [Tropicibacter naphthalenivorans]|uniref:Inner membrane protein YqiJ n=1 Tax=Tropicibacter naphthalenivorans TaxID=441103 RepID=A0A0P1GDP3_9RHOB|nr:OB-fold-containig protein [Tropicibacter naphthalenivorans]CUH79866.1 Inner membrane protein YqiJ [Tropicibacter naphthalenivorans]SMC75785.1 Protein of unknown function [Tropicibacter naphthalenivorans]
MLTEFLAQGFFPFTLALGLLLGLITLEVIFAVLGGTILGAGGEGMDGPELDIDAPDVADLDLDIDFDGLDIDASDLELPDLDAPGVDATPEVSGGLAAWLGFGKMPALIWLASVLLVFGIVGLAVQIACLRLFGAPLPATLAMIPAIVAALWFAKQFGALFARLLPKTETQALSERHLGRRSGVVSQGTAARGRPAEVRVTDRYGNIQYLRAEPLRDDAQIPQGTQVLVLRHRYEGGYLLVPLPTE